MDIVSKGTVEQEFMLMLLDRIDRLCDTVEKIKGVIPPIIEEYGCLDVVTILNNDYYVKCNKVFIRVHLKENQPKVKDFFIENSRYVLFYECDSKKLYENVDGITIQMLVEFNKSDYILKLLEKFYKEFKDILFEGKLDGTPIMVCYVNDSLMSYYYELHLTCGICAIPIADAKSMSVLPIDSKNIIVKMYSIVHDDNVMLIGHNTSISTIIGNGSTIPFYLVLLPM
jgi:hypothetical protein